MRASIWAELMKERSHSFRLDFDATNKIIGLIVEGEVTDQFLFDGYVALQEGLAQCGPCVCIVDYTGANRNPERSEGSVMPSVARHPYRDTNAFLNIFPSFMMTRKFLPGSSMRWMF
jgi:hypothetical protein